MARIRSTTDARIRVLQALVAELTEAIGGQRNWAYLHHGPPHGATLSAPEVRRVHSAAVTLRRELQQQITTLSNPPPKTTAKPSIKPGDIPPTRALGTAQSDFDEAQKRSFEGAIADWPGAKLYVSETTNSKAVRLSDTIRTYADLLSAARLLGFDAFVWRLCLAEKGEV